MTKVAVILPAAGGSVRFGGPQKKPFVTLAGRPVWQRAAELFWHLERIGITTAQIADGPDPIKVLHAFRERAKTFKEMAEGARFFYEDFADYEPKAAEKNLTAESKPALAAVRAKLAALTTWDAPSAHAALEAVAAELAGGKLGKVAQPVRVAVAGSGVSPPIDGTLALLGRERSLARLDRAIAWIGTH